MLSWLKKWSWAPETLPELIGHEGDLSVRLSDLPCLCDKVTGDRKYAFPEFGHDFLMAFHDSIGGVQHAHSRLVSGSTITGVVRLPQYPAIGIEMRGRPNDRVRTFESDIADALTNAFKAVGLRSS